MEFFMDDDLSEMLSGAGGILVVHGAETGYGLVDMFDEHLLQRGDSDLVGNVQAVTVKTNDFPTLKIGDSVVVNGQAAKVSDRLMEGDGALSKLLLRV